jgi:triacylglycerol lipase
MSTEAMNPVTAVTWGPFVQAAYEQYKSDPGQVNPAEITGMPAGYQLVRTIQMTDSFGAEESRVFYGFVAVGATPRAAVVAIRGTASAMEWWDDMHWDLVPFTQIPGGGKVAQGFYDIYRTFGTMAPGQPGAAQPSAAFAADIAHAAADGLAAGLDPALPIVVCGHSLGGALATLLAADLAANTPLKPQAWTFASPQVGDAMFAGCYGRLSTVSWRIYNQVDVVPYFPVDVLDSYQPVTAGYAINSLGQAHWSLGCAHALNTYLHVLAPGAVPLDPACAP